MHPELIRIGSFAIPTYGVLLASGFLAALALVRGRAPRFGLEADATTDVSIWVLIAALVGSKVLLVVVEGERLFSSWGAFVELMRSAGVFYGGLIGGGLAAVWLLRSRKIPFFAFADAAAPAVALGQAIGRLGCFSAGCCWGRECHAPWAVTFTDPRAHENVGVPLGIPLHPTQLYETIGTLVLAALIVLSDRRRPSRPAGRSFALYLTGYAALRFLIEAYRGDPRGSVLSGALSTSQLIALLGFAAGLAVLVLRRRPPAAAAPAA